METCWNCGREEDLGSGSCPHCGMPVRTAATAPAPAAAPAASDAPLFPAPAGRPDDADAPLFPPLPPVRRTRPAPDGGDERPDRSAPRRIVHVPGSVPDAAGGRRGPLPPPAGPAGTPPPGRMPPPARPAAAAPPPPPAPHLPGSSGGRRTGAHLEGLVDGPVVLDTVRHRLFGVGALVALGLLQLLFALFRLVASMGEGVSFGTALDEFLYFLVFLAVIGVALGIVFHVSLPGSGAGGIFSMGMSLVRGCLTLITTALRLVFTGLLSGFRSGTRAAQSAGQGELHQSVRRFRIRDMTGGVTACTLVGELQGPEVRQGDLIRVKRRGLRTGHIRIRRAEVLSVPGGPATSVVTTRTGRRFQLGVWADGLAWVLAAVLALNLFTQVTAVVG
ncbi:hypothetical protein ACIQNK_11250 [Streptomyces sp. NPDC091273]|uniref:hypothetical protein n=1 Tax=Streptomyces sp. NPDC091273 TaxID=3365982 RepID=UPI00381F17C6